MNRLKTHNKNKYYTQQIWFKNLTTMTILDEVKTVLSLGSTFSISTSTKELSVNKLVADMENIRKRIPTHRQNLRAKATSIVTHHLQKFRSQTRTIDLMYKKSKTVLKDNYLKVLNSDKGSVTVIMTEDEYLQKMYALLMSDSFKEFSTILMKT